MTSARKRLLDVFAQNRRELSSLPSWMYSPICPIFGDVKWEEPTDSSLYENYKQRGIWTWWIRPVDRAPYMRRRKPQAK